MKYINAKEVLPEELVRILQDYVQGCYLYIPKEEQQQVKDADQTKYGIELEKRDRHIYERYLEGWGVRPIADKYHLSESSVRRIVSKQRQQFDKEVRNMKDIDRKSVV